MSRIVTRTLTLAGAMLTALALASCGGRVALKPADGKAMPPRAYGIATPPGVDTLLAPSSQARPMRNAELLIKSDQRQNDPFDLPPGANAAAIPLVNTTSDNATGTNATAANPAPAKTKPTKDSAPD